MFDEVKEGEGAFLWDTGERLDESSDLLQINWGRGLNIVTYAYIHPRFIQGLINKTKVKKFPWISVLAS